MTLPLPRYTSELFEGDRLGPALLTANVALVVWTVGVTLGATALLSLWGRRRDAADSKAFAAERRAAAAATRDANARFDTAAQNVLLAEERKRKVVDRWHVAWGEAVWREHTLVSFFTSYRPDQPRPARAFALCFEWIICFFIEAVIYRIAYPAGLCDDVPSRAECESISAPFRSKRSCVYHLDSETCAFDPPTSAKTYLDPELLQLVFFALLVAPRGRASRASSVLLTLESRLGHRST